MPQIIPVLLFAKPLSLIGAVIKFTITQFALSALSKALAPKSKTSVRQEAASQLVTVRSSTEPRHIVYGQTLKSGPLVYATTTGAENQHLWMVVALVGHECEDILDVDIDGVTVTDAYIADAPDTNPSGVNVNDPSAPFSGYLGIQRMLGTSTQTYSTFLGSADPTNWGSDKAGAGVAYVIIRATFQQPQSENDTQAWKNAPTNIRALVKGKKIYDPRLDSTEGGSGSHRYADSTTWEWSENPALCVLDYLTDTDLGMGESHTRCDLTTFAAAANICEETVTIPSGTQDRYTCNGWTHAGKEPNTILAQLLSSMQGSLFYSQGNFRIYAGAYDTPAISLDEDALRANVTVQASTPRRDRYNAVQATYIDPARNYQPSECYPATSSTYETEDGGEQITNYIDLPFTNNEYEAQRICMMLLEQSRMHKFVTLPMNQNAYQVDVHDTINLTIDELSWSSAVFRITGYKIHPDGGVDLLAREENSNTYTDPSTGDYTTISAAGEVTFPSDVLPMPTNFAGQSYDQQINLTWTNPASRRFDFIEIGAAQTNDSDQATVIATTTANGYAYYPPDSNLRYFWVRSVNGDNERSDWAPAVASTVSGFVTDPIGGTAVAEATSFVKIDYTDFSTPTTDYNYVHGATAGAPSDTDVTKDLASALGGSGNQYTATITKQDFFVSVSDT